AEIRGGPLDADALAVKAIRQTFHQGAAVVAHQSDTRQKRIAQQIVAVVAGASGNTTLEKRCDGVAAITIGTERLDTGVGLIERHGDPSAVCAAIGILLRDTVLGIAARRRMP